MKNEDRKAKVLGVIAPLDEETQEAVRIELNSRARERLNANFQKHETGILEDLRKGYKAQGFSEESAKSGALEQWELDKLCDAVKVGLQTKEEGESFVAALRFARDANMSFLQTLTRSELKLHDLFKEAGELVKYDGQEFFDAVEDAGQRPFLDKLLSAFMKIEDEVRHIRELMKRMANAQRIMQDSSCWQNVRGVTAQEAEKLNRAMLEKIMPAMRKRIAQQEGEDVEEEGEDDVDRRNN